MFLTTSVTSGTRSKKLIHLYPVFYIPGINHRFLSVGTLSNQGLMLRGSSSHLEFRSHKSNWLEIVCEPHELGQTIYWLSAKLASAGSLLAKLLICSVDYDIMHHHFSHPSKDVLRHASGTTLGFPSITFPHEECICPRCAEGKITRSMFPHDFTCMLEFMNKNQAQFQEQITQAISALTSSRVTPPDSQASHSGSTVKLRNP